MSRFQKGYTQKLDFKRRLRSEMTYSEKLLWEKLRSKQFQSLKFRRQHGIGPFIVDFFCSEKALAIEIDGDIHATENQMTLDLEKENYLKSLELRVLRYHNDD